MKQWNMPHIPYKMRFSSSAALCAVLLIVELIVCGVTPRTTYAADTCPPGYQLIGGRGGNTCRNIQNPDQYTGVIRNDTQTTTSGSGNGTLNPPTSPNTYNPPTGNGSYFDDLGGGGSGGGVTQLKNPLGNNTTLTGFLLKIIDILIIFALPLIILAIIYAGFLYVMARGSEEQVTKATRSLTYAVIGGLLILGAKLLLSIIQGTVDQLIR
jgi:hypothetical protein